MEMLEGKEIKFDDIPRNIKEKYQIEQGIYGIEIHEPARINVDGPIMIVETPRCFEFWNDKVCIRLWKDTSIEHITVF